MKGLRGSRSTSSLPAISSSEKSNTDEETSFRNLIETSNSKREYSHYHCILCCPHISSLCGWRTWAGMSTVYKKRGKSVGKRNRLVTHFIGGHIFAESCLKIDYPN